MKTTMGTLGPMALGMTSLVALASTLHCSPSADTNPSPAPVDTSPLTIAVMMPAPASGNTDGGAGPTDGGVPPPPDGEMGPRDGAPPPDGMPPPRDGMPPPRDGMPPPPDGEMGPRDGMPPPPDGRPPPPPPGPPAPEAGPPPGPEGGPPLGGGGGNPDTGPPTGGGRPTSTDTFPELAWAVENINAAGGVRGRKLQLEYIDIRGAETDDELKAIAQTVADDPSYVAAIGPGQSSGLFAIAPIFQKAKKPIVSYTATSGEVLRAFGGQKYVWRTKESDIVQANLMVQMARDTQASRLALLTPVEGAGTTFFNWFGFFATDVGYATSAVELTTWPAEDVNCTQVLESALSTVPDILFAVPTKMADIVCLVQGWQLWRGKDRAKNKTRLVLADTGLDQFTLTNTLRDQSNGVEGISSAPDQTSGFEAAAKARWNAETVQSNMAAGYDAVLLLAYALQKSGGAGGEALDNAMRDVVGNRGEKVAWDLEGIRRGLGAIANGQAPDISGAGGSLTYDSKLFVDPVGTTYAHFVVENNKIVNRKHFDTSSFSTGKGALVAPTSAQNSSDGSYEPTSARAGLQVLIASFSKGWDNYRHQADALRQYQLLRKNGVSDDQIVLIGANDVAHDSANKNPGTIVNEVGGANVYASVNYDYTRTVTSAELMSILQGKATDITPTVLRPTSGTDIYVYLVGHGSTQGVSLNAVSTNGGLTADTSGPNFLTVSALTKALCAMQADKAYRRVLLVIESCHGGTFGADFTGGIEAGCRVEGNTVPLQGVVLLAAANPSEVSYATQYDSTNAAWLADGFSLSFAKFVETTSSSGSVRDAYQSAYVGVSGSHVSIYNSSAFGRVSQVTLQDFFKP